MPLFLTTDAVGLREDLTDEIVNITPTETPVFSAADKVRAEATLHEWQTDSLAAAASNVITEGADATLPTLTATTRVGNRTQIMRRVFGVSKTIEEVSKAGRDSEYSYQAEKAMKALARDTEFELIRQSSASGSARQLQGLNAAISTNTSTGATRDLTETLYNDMLQTVFDSGGNPNVTLCNGFQKRQISTFGAGTQGLQRTIALGERRLINSVQQYDSDFGEQTVIIDRHLNSDRILLLEMALIKIAVLRNTKHYPLPDDGGGPRGMIEHELTLVYGNEAAHGEILNLSTS